MSEREGPDDGRREDEPHTPQSGGEGQAVEPEPTPPAASEDATPTPEPSREEPPAAGDAAVEEQTPLRQPPSALPDYYAALGVAPGADQRTVAAGYDRLAREYQPDINAPATNPERMAEIDEAFDVLDDPRRRAAYDRRRRGVVRSSDTEATAGGIIGRVRSDRTLLAAVGLTTLGIIALIAALAVFLLDPFGGGGNATGKEITTSSGLKYVDEVIGGGAEAVPGKHVSVDYTGTLQDGTQFGSSQGQPFGFTLGQGPIAGFDEGITSMKVGGKRKLIIPPDLAYGDKANGPIPANATLIFEVQLLGVSEPSPTPSLPPGTPPPTSRTPTTTASGLRYIDLAEGTGPSPTAGQQVTVNYEGWLSSGGKFDSSLDRGQPFSFIIGQGGVIPGWDEGVATMKVGGKRRLIIPPNLGYGAQSNGPIPANSTLIFDIDLLSVSDVTPTPAGTP